MKRILGTWEVKTYHHYHDKKTNQMFYMPTFYRFELNKSYSRNCPIMIVTWNMEEYQYRYHATGWPEEGFKTLDGLTLDPSEGMSICDQWGQEFGYHLITPAQMKKIHTFL